MGVFRCPCRGKSKCRDARRVWGIDQSLPSSKSFPGPKPGEFYLLEGEKIVHGFQEEKMFHAHECFKRGLAKPCLARPMDADMEMECEKYFYDEHGLSRA